MRELRCEAGRFREAYLEGLDRPEHLPPVTRVLPNIDGTLWLRREENLDKRVRWWVLDRDGELLAELRSPSSVRVLEVFEETVWAVEEDDLDVPFIVRFRVDKRGNGA